MKPLWGFRDEPKACAAALVKSHPGSRANNWGNKNGPQSVSNPTPSYTQVSGICS